MWVYTGDFERIDHLSPLRLHADNQHEALGASMRRAAKTSRSHQARFLRGWRAPWPVWMADKKWWSSVTFCQTVAWTRASSGRSAGGLGQSSVRRRWHKGIHSPPMSRSFRAKRPNLEPKRCVWRLFGLCRPCKSLDLARLGSEWFEPGLNSVLR